MAKTKAFRVRLTEEDHDNFSKIQTKLRMLHKSDAIRLAGAFTLANMAAVEKFVDAWFQEEVERKRKKLEAR